MAFPFSSFSFGPQAVSKKTTQPRIKVRIVWRVPGMSNSSFRKDGEIYIPAAGESQ
jgi:hypothetical protein